MRWQSLGALALTLIVAVSGGCSDDASPGAHDTDAVTPLDIAGIDASSAAPDALSDTAAPEQDSGQPPPDAASDDADVVGDIGVLPDVPPVDAAQDVASVPDVGPADVGATDVAAPPDVTCDDPQVPFDYTCTSDPATCPQGICLLGLCLGPVLDADRWADCGDGTCEPCESATWCPVDCGAPPALTGEKDYDNATTITVDIHGFSNKGDKLDELVYGADKGCGGMVGALADWGVNRPCGDNPEGEKAPNQVAKVEYYGAKPAPWLEPDDVAEIEKYPYSGGPLGLQRYALVTAKWIRHKLDVSGATHVNLLCHSMGCLVTRMMIENNYENLAAENRFVRWVSSAGVLAGARLSRLFDNPSVQDGAEALGLELSDFILMNPDYVMDYAASWDHELHQGNNPLFGGMIIHHVCGTSPLIEEAFGLPLLDLSNPEDLPNDGILHTVDQYFHSQTGAASFVAPSGHVLSSTRSYVHVDHMNVPDSEATGLLSTAGLFHHRKVSIRLIEVTLLDDKEASGLDDIGDPGTPPAELAIESEVRYDPFVKDTTGKSVLVSEQKLDQRTPEPWTQSEGETQTLSALVFEGPVLDGMTSLRLDMKLLEVDWYPRFGIAEWALNVSDSLVEYNGQVPLEDHVIELSNGNVKAKLEVVVETLY